MKEQFSLFVLGVLVFALATPAHSQSLSLTKLLTIDGEAQMDHFSETISGVGDVNNDGFADFLVGSPGWQSEVDPRDPRDIDPRVGKGYLFLGGSQVSTEPVLTFPGTFQNQNYACAVAGVGDVNADGIDDYVIGANYLYLSYARVSFVLGKPGLAQVFFGGNTESPEMTLLQPGKGKQKDRFGTAVVGKMDFNGDGHSDFVVSSPGRPEFPKANRPCSEGSEDICKWRVFPPERVFLFLGGPDFDSEPDFVFSVSDTDFVPAKQYFIPDEHWYGESVAVLGDINSDGYDDFAVNELSTRNVYVYFGGENPSTDPALTISVGDFSDRFGCSMASAGDLNNDGHTDFVIAAEAADNNGTDSGTVYVFYGGPDVDGIPDQSFHGENPSDRFGTEVIYAGDLNNDGHGDLTISARNAQGGYDSNPTLWSGKVYVFYGGPSFDTEPDPVVSSWLSYEKFGVSLAAAGDVDNDGFDDLLVGAPLKKLRKDDAYRGSLYLFGLPLLTPVFNVSMDATVEDGKVLLKWNTLADGIPVGFRISRLEGGLPTPIHSGLLPGTSDFFVDTGVQPGRTYEYWIDVMERTGNVKTFGPALVSVPVLSRLRVGLPYPNPMLGSAMRVEYEGKAQAAGIYDLQGRLVQSLQLSGSALGGTLAWEGHSQDGQRVPDGIYFLRVTGNDQVISKRIIKLEN